MDPVLLGIGLAAGAVAALNPCGFAMLPAYLALVVDRAGDDGAAAAAGRALRMTAGMTLGFVAVFAVFAAVVLPLSLALEQYLPQATVVIGVVLVALGAWLLSGRPLGLRVGSHGGAPTGGLRSMVAYGVAYAVASLSCTVGPFLAVTASAARTGTVLAAAGVVLAFALGMAGVVGALAISVALARVELVRGLRRALPYVGRASGGLLVVAGLYVAYYGWYEARVFAGGDPQDPVVDTALAVQGWLSRLVLEAGPVLLLVVVVVVVVMALVRSRRTRSPAG